MERESRNKRSGKKTIKPKCKRCGKCCVIFNKYSNSWEDCRFLEHTPHSKFKTRCRIYRLRIGTPLGWGYYCEHPSEYAYNLPQCPYNVKGRPMHPLYKDWRK